MEKGAALIERDCPRLAAILARQDQHGSLCVLCVPRQHHIATLSVEYGQITDERGPPLAPGMNMGGCLGHS